jgi:hypothetical protein
MLSAARGALEEALEFAEENDLWFSFAGVRRGPGEYAKRVDVNDQSEVTELLEEIAEDGGLPPQTVTDDLDLSEEWVGSWC